MRAMMLIAVGLVVGYYLGCFTVPLALVKGSAGEVNRSLANSRGQ